MSSRLRWVALLLTLATGSTPLPQRLVFDLHPRHRGTGRRKSGREAQVSDDTGRPIEEYDSRRLEAAKLRGHHVTAESYATTLQNYGDIQYHMLVEIGKNCKRSEDPQIFRVVPDTGSSDLWVPAANCTHCDGRRFDEAKSCSSQPVGTRVDFKYGDGTTASGVALVDTIKVGDLKVKEQFFIQVDDMDATSLEMSDGILGLAHHYDDKKSAAEGRTFMSTLFSEHAHMLRMFSFHLTGMSDEPSQIVFGDPDVKNHAKEPLTYGKAYYMSHTSLWLTSVYSIGFSKTGVERVFPTAEILGAPALVDSGSSLIVLMPDVWDALIEELSLHLRNCRIEDTDGSVAMCECPKDFGAIPSLVINLINEDNLEHPLCMAADEYILKSVDPISGKTRCVPSIQRGNRHQPVPLIFGMTFMRTFYTNFDLQNHRIGFARSTSSSLPAHAQCTVHNKKERELWLMTTGFVAVALCFTVYLCCCGDIGACCGWPSCSTSQPCGGYSNLDNEKVEDTADLAPGSKSDFDMDTSINNSKAMDEMGGPTRCEKALSLQPSENSVELSQPRSNSAGAKQSAPLAVVKPSMPTENAREESEIPQSARSAP